MSSHNPWKTISSREIYKNPWMTVREDQVVRPDGEKGIYGVVEMRHATGVVALDEKLEIYLVGQYRYPTECYTWEIIEGGSDPGESPLEAAQRELREEAGLEASDWEQVGNDFQLSNCCTSERATLFIATGLTEVPATPEGTEVLAIKKLPLQDALEMVLKGEIVESLSVIGIFFAARRFLGSENLSSSK